MRYVCVTLPLGVPISETGMLQPHHADPGSTPQATQVDRIPDDPNGIEPTKGQPPHGQPSAHTQGRRSDQPYGLVYISHFYVIYMIGLDSPI